MNTISNNTFVIQNKKVGVTNIQRNNNIYFRAVSINPKERKSLSKTGQIIEEGINKIKELLNGDKSEELDKMEEHFQEVTKEMEIRRKIATEKPWWKNTGKMLRRITKMELKQKKIIIDKKVDSVQQNNERVSIIKKIVKETEEAIKLDNINADLRRMKTHRQIDDMKGNISHQRGFDKIAGYHQEKNILNKYFISEIKKEQRGEDANVPNSVLFFGPTGNGKTTFAKAFANETGCKLIPIRADFTGKGVNDFESDHLFLCDLNEKAEKSEEHFQKTGIRSILFMDEITKVAGKNSTILPELTEFLSNCSAKYHCTLFSASNHPLNIALPMTGEKSVFPYRVSLDPPDKKNKVDILKFYLNGRLGEDANYSKLEEKMENKEKDAQGMFNIAQVKEDICLEGIDKKISEDDVYNNIDKTKPNIDRKSLDKYSDEIDKLISNEVTE